MEDFRKGWDNDSEDLIKKFSLENYFIVTEVEPHQNWFTKKMTTTWVKIHPRFDEQKSMNDIYEIYLEGK
jgi:hypothetical protein